MGVLDGVLIGLTILEVLRLGVDLMDLAEDGEGTIADGGDGVEDFLGVRGGDGFCIVIWKGRDCVWRALENAAFGHLFRLMKW